MRESFRIAVDGEVCCGGSLRPRRPSDQATQAAHSSAIRSPILIWGINHDSNGGNQGIQKYSSRNDGPQDVNVGSPSFRKVNDRKSLAII